MQIPSHIFEILIKIASNFPPVRSGIAVGITQCSYRFFIFLLVINYFIEIFPKLFGIIDRAIDSKNASSTSLNMYVANVRGLRTKSHPLFAQTSTHITDIYAFSVPGLRFFGVLRQLLQCVTVVNPLQYYYLWVMG